MNINKKVIKKELKEIIGNWIIDFPTHGTYKKFLKELIEYVEKKQEEAR